MSFSIALVFPISLCLTVAAVMALRAIEKAESPDCMTTPSWRELGALVLVWTMLALTRVVHDGALLVLGPLAVAAWSDERHRIVPDEIVIAALLVALAAAHIAGEDAIAVEGILTAGTLAFAFFAVGEMLRQPLLGFGDVKYLVVIGAVLGPLGGPLAFAASAFIGLLRILVTARRNRTALRDVGAFAHTQNLWWGIPVAAGVAVFARP